MSSGKPHGRPTQGQLNKGSRKKVVDAKRAAAASSSSASASSSSSSSSSLQSAESFLVEDGEEKLAPNHPDPNEPCYDNEGLRMLFSEAQTNVHFFEYFRHKTTQKLTIKFRDTYYEEKRAREQPEPEGDSCAMCLELLNDPATLSTLNCACVYHTTCLILNERQNNFTCPIRHNGPYTRTSPTEFFAAPEGSAQYVNGELTVRAPADDYEMKLVDDEMVPPSTPARANKVFTVSNNTLRSSTMAGNIPIHSTNDIFRDIINRHPDEAVRNAMIDLLPTASTLVVSVSDITAWQPRQIVSRSTTPSSQSSTRVKSFYLGSKIPISQVQLLLEECESNIISFSSFNVVHSPESLQVGLMETEVLTFGEHSTTAELIAQGLLYAGKLRKSNQVSLKSSYFLGRVIANLRRLNYEWKKIVADFDNDEAGRLKETTLRGIMNMSLFLHDYPRFLRVNLPFTTLLGYAKNIIAALKLPANAELKAKWSQLED